MDGDIIVGTLPRQPIRKFCFSPKFSAMDMNSVDIIRSRIFYLIYPTPTPMHITHGWARNLQTSSWTNILPLLESYLIFDAKVDEIMRDDELS